MGRRGEGRKKRAGTIGMGAAATEGYEGKGKCGARRAIRVIRGRINEMEGME